MAAAAPAALVVVDEQQTAAHAPSPTARSASGSASAGTVGSPTCCAATLGLAFNARYGAMGLLVVPYFLLIELLAPVVELVGLVAVVVGLILGVVNVGFAVLFVLVAYGFGIALTAYTLAIEEWTYQGYGSLGDRLWLLLLSLFEGLGYRQLTAVWRLRGIVRYARGRREWGTMTREGFAGVSR